MPRYKVIAVSKLKDSSQIHMVYAPDRETISVGDIIQDVTGFIGKAIIQDNYMDEDELEEIANIVPITKVEKIYRNYRSPVNWDDENDD